MSQDFPQEVKDQAESILQIRRLPQEVSDRLVRWPSNDLETLRQVVAYIDATDRQSQLDVALRGYPGSTRMTMPASAAVLLPRMDVKDVTTHLAVFEQSKDWSMKQRSNNGLPNLLLWCVTLDRQDLTKVMLYNLKPYSRETCINTTVTARPRPDDLPERIIDHLVGAGLPQAEIVTVLAMSIGNYSDGVSQLERLAIYRGGAYANLVDISVQQLLALHRTWAAPIEPRLLSLAERLQHRAKLQVKPTGPVMMAP